MTEDLRAIAAAVGIRFFSDTDTRRPEHLICWHCYQVWVGAGRQKGLEPPLLDSYVYSCPACGGRDLRRPPSDDESEDVINATDVQAG